MAVPRKLVAVPNAATRELWRIAENGAIDELEAVLPRADINGRNEHGMTALMRAVYHGRVEMVRVLLDHGADPNIARNDNFTALSLAAFFGHAEIVDILLRRGANSDVATRFGTSPYLWAKARSFGDVARCLEKRREEFKKSAPEKTVSAVVPTKPAGPTAAEPIIVKKLKDPPEIWDLVHEAPRDFNPRSAFMARLGGSLRGVVVPLAGLVIVACVGITAVMFLKNRRPRPAAPTVVVRPLAPAPAPVAPMAPIVSQPVETTQPGTNSVLTETPAAVVHEPVRSEITPTVTRRSRPLAMSRPVSTHVVSEDVMSEEGTAQVAAPPVVAAPKPDSRPAVGAEPKHNAPASSQMIVPPKPSQPKAKVIQWP